MAKKTMDFLTPLQYYQDNNWEEAARLCLQLIELNPSHSDAYHLLGIIHYQKNEHSLAVQMLKKAVELAPEFPHFRQNLGNALRESQQWGAALQSYQEAIKLKPDFAEAYHNIGGLLEDQGKTNEAIQYYEKAIQFNPQAAPSYNNLANIYRLRGDITQAIRYYQKALEINPHFQVAYENMDKLLQKDNLLQQALVCYQKLQNKQSIPTLKPDLKSPQSLLELGHACLSDNNLQAALACFQSILPIKPDEAEAYYYTARILQKLANNTEVILQYYKKACELAPQRADYFINFAQFYMLQGQIDKARQHYHHAHQIAPSKGKLLGQLLLMPPVYQNQQEILTYRKNLIQNIQSKKLVQKLDKLPFDQHHFMEELMTPFFLAYQGFNDKDIMVQIAKILAPLVTTNIHSRQPSRNHSKIKIGFISRYFCEHSVAHCFAAILQKLDRNIFEITVFFAPGTLKDKVTEQIQQDVEKHFFLPATLDEASCVVASCQLDILVFTDIGMEIFTYLLAFNRMATFQCVLAGHPVTTGIPTVDYYISNRWAEPPGAQAHYSEKLVILPHMLSDYQKPRMESPPKSRTELGLPEHQHIYFCPMTLFKVHPDFDRAIEQILMGDSNGVVVFAKDNSEALYSLLIQRFQKNLSHVIERIIFVPWLPQRDFLSLLKQADVILDTWHFGGGNTAYIALGLGCPMVTWPSPYQRGRHCQGFYRRMGMEDCIAESQEGYVELAIKIATDPHFSAQIRHKIVTKNDRLFHQTKGTQDLTDFFIGLVEK